MIHFLTTARQKAQAVDRFLSYALAFPLALIGVALFLSIIVPILLSLPFLYAAAWLVKGNDGSGPANDQQGGTRLGRRPDA